MNTRRQKNVYFGSGTTHTRKKTYLDKLLLLEETGYEKRQTSMIKTTIKMIGILLNVVHFQVHKDI